MQNNEVVIDASKLPEELLKYTAFFESNDTYGTVAVLDAEITNTYSFSLPILIEQSGP